MHYYNNRLIQFKLLLFICQLRALGPLIPDWCTLNWWHLPLCPRAQGGRVSVHWVHYWWVVNYLSSLLIWSPYPTVSTIVNFSFTLLSCKSSDKSGNVNIQCTYTTAVIWKNINAERSSWPTYHQQPTHVTNIYVVVNFVLQVIFFCFNFISVNYHTSKTKEKQKLPEMKN